MTSLPTGARVQGPQKAVLPGSASKCTVSQSRFLPQGPHLVDRGDSRRALQAQSGKRIDRRRMHVEEIRSLDRDDLSKAPTEGDHPPAEGVDVRESGKHAGRPVVSAPVDGVLAAPVACEPTVGDGRREPDGLPTPIDLGAQDALRTKRVAAVNGKAVIQYVQDLERQPPAHRARRPARSGPARAFARASRPRVLCLEQARRPDMMSPLAPRGRRRASRVEGGERLDV